MPKLFDPQRFEKIKEVVLESRTQIQLDTRREVALRLKNYVDTCETDEEFYARVWNDFPVWSVAFINDDSEKPLFPAKWQIEYARMMGQRKYVWAMCSRKTGKSTLLSIKNLHDMCGLIPKRIICFAPTMKQDFVFDKTAKYLLKSPYLYEVFAAREGSVTKDYIELANGSSCQNKTIGLNTKGELIRGEYGDIVTVDEVQKIEEQVMRQVISPIIADAYSEKKFRLIGTPNLYANPHLESEWRTWKRDSNELDTEYGCMNIDWQRGVAEGCLDEKYVLKEKERMTPDEFAMEYEAVFPEQGSRFFDIGLLETCCQDNQLVFKRGGQKIGFTYGMAVDYAAFVNRTQMVVGEYDYQNKTLTYVAWTEIDPKRDRIDYENQILAVKDMFWDFDCDWICPDATSNQDALIRMLQTGVKPIPPGRFYKTGDRYGYCATDVLNDQTWRNHRQQMVKGRLKVPRGGATEERFKEKWCKEHNELDVRAIRNGQMIKLEEPKNGYKDLAVACAMLSLYIPMKERGAASFDVVGW